MKHAEEASGQREREPETRMRKLLGREKEPETQSRSRWAERESLEQRRRKPLGREPEAAQKPLPAPEPLHCLLLLLKYSSMAHLSLLSAELSPPRRGLPGLSLVLVFSLTVLNLQLYTYVFMYLLPIKSSFIHCCICRSKQFLAY